MARRKKLTQQNPIHLGRPLDGASLTFPLDALREIHFLDIGRTGQRKTLNVLSRVTQFHAYGDGIIFIDVGGDRAAYRILENSAKNRPAYRKLKRAAEGSGKNIHLWSIDMQVKCSRLQRSTT